MLFRRPWLFFLAQIFDPTKTFSFSTESMTQVYVHLYLVSANSSVVCNSYLKIANILVLACSGAIIHFNHKYFFFFNFYLFIYFDNIIRISNNLVLSCFLTTYNSEEENPRWLISSHPGLNDTNSKIITILSKNWFITSLQCVKLELLSRVQTFYLYSLIYN